MIKYSILNLTLTILTINGITCFVNTKRYVLAMEQYYIILTNSAINTLKQVGTP